MDPVTVIGLVSNILSFIDFGVEIVRGAREIYDSPSGVLEENKSQETVITEIKRFSSKLIPPDDTNLHGDEKALCVLAKECESLSHQLIQLLEKAKPKNPKSKTQSLIGAWKSKTNKPKRMELEQRLDHCRGQLELQLGSLTSSKNNSLLEALQNSITQDSAKIERLLSQTEQLREGAAITTISPEAQAQLQKLLVIQDDALSAVLQDRIVKSLEFEGMYRRYDAVEEAHFKTFRWIVAEDTQDKDSEEEDSQDDDDEISQDEDDEDSQDGNDEDSQDDDDEDSQDDDGYEAQDNGLKNLARAKFTNWLSSGSGIFHISGKLGSGKSTLMKFICENHHTKNKLELWAGDRKLVFANFFFWKPGNEQQKSLTGLLRSLLHDAVRACPELIVDVLPRAWDQVKSAPWQVQTKLRISDSDVREAFSRLIKHPKLYKKHRFCFFIDGLDEYEGTRQHDQKYMVDLLSSWTHAAPSDVKLCVSSREHSVFMNAFPSKTRLRLHDLTEQDMKNYVHLKLGHMDDTETKTKVVDAIIEKAQGIFLWVTLVVKSIREQLEHDCEPSNLMDEVNSLPDELNGLFEHILKSFRNPDRAYRTLAMVLHSEKVDVPLSLLAYSFYDEYERDHEFAMRENFHQSTLEAYSQKERLDRWRKKLSGYCGGLVEDVRDSRSGLLIVEFTHRSVPEFLETAFVRERKGSHLKGFDVTDALSQLFLASLWVKETDQFQRGTLWQLHPLLKMRHHSDADQEPFRFLECVEVAVVARGHVIPGPEVVFRNIIIWDSVSTGLIVAFSGRGKFKESLNLGLPLPMYISAFLGFHEYPVWKVEQMSKAFDSSLKLVLLVYCCVRGRRRPSGSILTSLLERGILSPQIPTSMWLVRIAEAEAGLHISVWQHFIVYLVTWFPNGLREDVEGYSGWVEKFLEFGADPHIWASRLKNRASRLENDSTKKFEFQLTLGRDRREVRFSMFMHEDEVPFKNLSIREWVSRWDSGLENKERVLELLDRNSAMEEFAIDRGRVTELIEEPEEKEGAEAAVDQANPERARVNQASSLAEDHHRSKLSFKLIGGGWMHVFVLGALTALLIFYFRAIFSTSYMLWIYF